jgi:lysophospholipase L1-like esterase
LNKELFHMTIEPDSKRHAPRTGLRLLIICCDLCFFATVLLIIATWLINPLVVTLFGRIHLQIGWGIKPFLGAAFFLGAHLFLRRQGADNGLFAKKWFQGLNLAAISLFIALLFCEFLLAVLPLQFADTPPIVIRGEQQKETTPNPDTIIGDPVLRWKYLPGGTFMGLQVNRLGYLDREVSEKKAPGTVRVICMGDSVTSQAPAPYSETLHKALQNSPPDTRHWEAFNMGVVGYSSLQGLRVFQLQAKDLQPDYVTLYFGWNDHWKSGLKPDSEIMAIPLSANRAALVRRLEQRRVGRLAVAAWGAWQRRASGGNPGNVDPWDLNRVPPEEYKNTLARFIREIRAAGAVPILITAPRAETLTPLLVHNGQATSVEQAVREHDRYVEITRKVAAETGTDLIDLAAEMQGAEHAHLFKDDGIHMTYPGLEFIAGAIDKKLREIVKRDNGK